MRRRPLFLWIIGFSLSLNQFCFAESRAEPLMRVMIEENQKLVRIEIKGAYRILLLPSLQVARSGQTLPSTGIVPSLRGMKLGQEEWLTRGIRIEPVADRDLFLDQTRYRGAMDILKDKNGSLLAINRIGIESYLVGVLAHEVAHWWPIEALKAQAVAARTYAFYQRQVSKNVEFDLKSTTSSQVYGGSTVERSRVRSAVDQTSGQVLTDKGKNFPAYFHATCGGVTAGAQELWKIYSAPIAGGVRCNYCWFSPHFSWQTKVPLLELEEKLNKNNRPVGQILKIEVISLTPSGRVGSIRITGNAGETILAAKDFRIWVGGNKMRSTQFTVTVNEDFAEFQGKGWGHGVGLCQWGTLGQALLGHSYEKILNFYYPGSEISKYESVSQWI